MATVFVKAQNTDTLNLPYAIKKETLNPYDPPKATSNINLKDPSNVVTKVEYDAASNQFVIYKKVGENNYAIPYSMSFSEYQNYSFEKNKTEYWRQRYKSEVFEQQSSLIPKINVGSEAFETIFGSSTIDIKPQGSASLRFGVKISNNENPNISTELQRNTTFDFKEEIQMNVVGKVGDNLEMKVSYNTESQFDFDNTMNLRYQGKEDDIIQKIEAGDVSLPLTTSLITGSQSLFGILSELKFGKLYVTSVFSQQEGETKTINVEGGAQKSEYDMRAIDYDRNRHFFIGHYFRENYDRFLSNLPLKNTPININRIEVWVTNTTRSTTDARNIVAFMDLAEAKSQYVLYDSDNPEQAIKNTALVSPSGTLPEVPQNQANDLYENVTALGGEIRNIGEVSPLLESYGLVSGEDFEKVEFARKLQDNEFYFDPKLGYISVNAALNADEILAVSYEYTYNGTTYQVGEFASDVEVNETNPSALLVKLLKNSTFTPRLPNWDLMMKNIYSIGAFQVNREDFVFEIEYYDDETGTRLFNLPDSRLKDSVKKEKLLRVLNLDELNTQQNPVSGGDGVFDFVEGATIRPDNGRVMFPMVEPFGGYLANKIDNETLESKYVFQALYDSTQNKAEQITSKNKYFLSGYYKSAGGSEIFLNSFNIPEGSVKVTAGGIILMENVDYTVDYNLGRVKIVNESYLASGTPIKITLESNSLFSIQSKTLMGAHLDYRFNADFNLGATVMNLTERPLTQKVNIGEEPISNTIWGLNGSYRAEVPFLTRVVDFLPFIETKEMSTITLEGEFAQLVPGHNKAVGDAGQAFIDDFEGSESSIDLKSRTGWVLASTPQKNRFPEAALINNLAYGFNRAKLAWYQIDPLFFRSGSPVSQDEQSNLQVYRVQEQHIFPNKDIQNGIPTEISTLDLAFYPTERGPYNFDVDGSEGYSAGLDGDGKLLNPESRWGGVMRELTTNDFESTNVEYIRFWLMDPFVENDSLNPGGEFIINLGNISEDILRDNRKMYEHGLPTSEIPAADEYIETTWGRIPVFQTSNPSFVNDGTLRSRQDIGMDGLSSEIIRENGVSDESFFFSDYLNDVATVVTNPGVLADITNDPSNDNYHHFRGGDYDAQELGILERYKRFNNHEGNTPVSEQSPETYNTVGQQYPDEEDINGDFTLTENESYFEYTMHLTKENMVEGRNYITNIQPAQVSLKNGKSIEVNWYEFKVPISEPTAVVGAIQDFRSIRFMRMFMTNWQQDAVLRFAKLELVRSEWRKYDFVLKEADESLVEDENNNPNSIPFNISTINIEGNGKRFPVNYVLPPGVDRQQDPSNTQLRQLNEQSMSLVVDSLADGYAKAVYKNINMDMRDYGKLQMYIHAESRSEIDPLNDKDLTVFVRLGSDFTDNYYEYELPLEVTPWWELSPYDQFNDEDRETVWPEKNNLEIIFEELLMAKQQRNTQMRKANSSISFLTQFVSFDAKGNKITIKGNPNLANVQTMMIGIRNPSAKWNVFSNTDDSQPKSGEIWVNELRLTDFNEDGGWAATGRMTARLADFGTVSVAGSTVQPGFGSIEQKTQERAKAETNQIDVATNFELGKFFPQKANVRVPMYWGYSRAAINPQFNPLDQDIPLEVTLKDDNISEAEKKDLVDKSQDLTERKSLNFTNVGIGRKPGKKVRFYSPSNLSVSYAYSELKHRDVHTDYNRLHSHNTSLNYIFNNRPKNIRPFAKSSFFRKPALKLIGDFNFYYAPTQISFRTTVNRRYNETLLRNLNNPSQLFTPTVDKNYTWQRQFDIKYNFAKSLKFDFATNTNALIDEPDGRIDRSDEYHYQQFKDTVIQSFLSFGTPNNYNHKFNASYTVPINKIPILNWISLNARYSALYNWDRGALPKNNQDSLWVGNSIKNSQKITLNTQLNMNNLYRKVGFLEKIDKKYKKSLEQRRKPVFEDVSFAKEQVRLKANTKKRITHNLGTEEIEKVEVSQNGNLIEIDYEIVNDNRISVEAAVDVEAANIVVQGKKQVKTNPIIIGLEQVARIAMGFKQISASYAETNGSILGGYNMEHRFENMFSSPGGPFIFGWQDPNFGYDMAMNDALIKNENLTTPFTYTSNKNATGKATFQPFKDLRVDFAGQRNVTQQFSEYYYPRYDESTGNYAIERQNYSENGSYSISIWMMNTSFEGTPNQTNPGTSAFDRYQKNLLTIAWNHADGRYAYAQQNGIAYNPGTIRDSMPVGYTRTDPQVAIPAFLAAYTGVDAKKIDLNVFSWSFLRPSWRIKYDGLSKIGVFKKYFKNITFSNAYNGAFTIGSYASNIAYDYDAAESGYSFVTNPVDSVSFLSQYHMSSFTATESYVPLIGVEMTWKNNILTRFEYKKTRTLAMNLVNNQLIEDYNWEYTIGTGYRFDQLRIIVNKKPVVSDLNLRGDLSVRDNIQIKRNLAQNFDDISAGQRVVALKMSAEYQLSDKLMIRAYFDHNMTDPKVGSFRRSDTEFGVQLRFSLAQ